MADEKANELERLATLIDDLGDKTELLKEVASLKQQIIDLEIERYDLHSEVEKWRVQARSLYQLVDMMNIPTSHHVFIGTVKSIRTRDDGLNHIIVIEEGKKRIRYIIDDSGFARFNIKQGQRVKIWGGIRPVTIPTAHKTDGFQQCSPIEKIEILKN